MAVPAIKSLALSSFCPAVIPKLSLLDIPAPPRSSALLNSLPALNPLLASAIDFVTFSTAGLNSSFPALTASLVAPLTAFAPAAIFPVTISADDLNAERAFFPAPAAFDARLDTAFTAEGATFDANLIAGAAINFAPFAITPPGIKFGANSTAKSSNLEFLTSLYFSSNFSLSPDL